MLKVLRPSKNRLTQGYSDKHRGYDHSGRGDRHYYSSLSGVVIQSKNTETKNWINKGKLTTKDYGNYIKIKGEIDGRVVYQMGAHFKPRTVLPKGTKVQIGQVVAEIGNTGNSTGKHSHTEYRNSQNKNISVEFVDEIEKPMSNKKQNIIDVYKATTGEYPNDDTINARLQENKNLVELIQDRLQGDETAKEFWLDRWGIDPKTDQAEIIERYQAAFFRFREILRPVGIKAGDDTEKIVGKLAWLVQEYQKLTSEKKPQIKLKEDDLVYFTIGSFVLGVLVKGGGRNGTKKS